jgi:hypothetical protein
MTKTILERSSFLLIDNAMLADVGVDVLAADERPDWIACIYEDKAGAVSPHLIDIHAAHEAGQLDRMMGVVNALPTQLHVSIIDTTLSFAELAHHLRRLAMVRTTGGKKLTLRFADCAVLPELAKAFTPEQWAALAGPMVRWHVHGYDANLYALPTVMLAAPCATLPLLLTEQQVAALHEAMKPNNVLANLRAARHGTALPGTAEEQQQWSRESYRLWREFGNGQEIVVRWLTAAALETRGAILGQEALCALLADADLDAIRAGLQINVTQHVTTVQ